MSDEGTRPIPKAVQQATAAYEAAHQRMLQAAADVSAAHQAGDPVALARALEAMQRCRVEFEAASKRRYEGG